MMHRLTENVKLLQKVALFHGGMVLLIKRSPDEDPRPGCWDLPGGNSEWPESRSSVTGLHIQDAIREVYEETQISLLTAHFSLDKLSYLETHFDSEKQLYSICFGWQLTLDEKPEVTLSHEHTEYTWVGIDEVDNYEFGTIGGWIKEVIKN